MIAFSLSADMLLGTWQQNPFGRSILMLPLEVGNSCITFTGVNEDVACVGVRSSHNMKIGTVSNYVVFKTLFAKGHWMPARRLV